MRCTTLRSKAVGSYWVPGWCIVSSDNRLHQGAKQGFAALTGVMHELEEAEIVARQFGTALPRQLDGSDVDGIDQLRVASLF
jgi:hypothetical protein